MAGRPRDDNPEQDTIRRLGRASFGVFFVLFSVFSLNVLLGKAKIQFGWEIPYLLGDVPEFLLLLVTAVFLMLAALARERSSSGQSS
jgi:hypothetical protein